ncbi:PQQ-dependent sugar dehydrogenase [Micromonospora sp. WMMD882]|uniref:PQQ-dependent sugar dehydrogenase n=1 Tax=Micromonospora sp. WMMD882 TaxID=3015151 RepID=UPI00248B195D|nr:PQQ-dependent sugar dehydrogenase [Micromonospora sp. WMMD882]WBB77584.1 PQQ-dependent sugar dehydrogenase [Micromonospora sp. WMMD882]
MSDRVRRWKLTRIGLVGALLAGVAVAAPVTTATPANAVTLPAGFQEQVVFSGLNLPTNVEFAPDGRIFVAEKGGRIRVYDDLADTTPTTFADLSANVHNQHDRGLLGLAVHPQFPTQPYVYVLYSYDAPPGQTAPYWNDNCAAVGGTNGGQCIVTGRLSRLTAAGNQMTGSEQVLVQDWCQQYASHSVGDLAFGADGMLYVSAGDGASYDVVDYGQRGNPVNPCGDPPGGAMTPPTAEGGALRAQDLRTPADPTSLDGTLLRLDPATGQAAPGNPLAGSSDANARRIVADGMRNPYRITVRPGTNDVWLGDVGWTKWEEINRVANPTAGVSNFGWPCYEGAGRQSGYDGANLDVCENLYTGAGQTAPFYTYDHAATVVAGETCPTGSSSVGGVAFYPAAGGSYPAAYRGALFFSDYSRDCIWAMLPAAPGGLPVATNRQTFAAAAANPVDLAVGPGGDLYYVDIGGGALRRIRYFPGNQPPVAQIAASPTSGPAPLTVSFDATGSTDPDPADQGKLTYQWDFTNDGTVDSTAATVQHTYPAGGPYTARLRVVDSLGASATATVPIQTGNSMPTAVIDTPGASFTWAVNTPITFTGHATDPDQGTLPATALSWRMNLHHCSAPDNCHIHVLQEWTGVAGGSIAGPDHEYPSYLELVLTATDAGGLSHSTSVRLDPRTVNLTFDTNPSGLQVAVNSGAQATPFTRTVIQGSTNTVSAVTPQTSGGQTYAFSSWSDGGAQTHIVTAPTTPTTYTAGFTAQSASVRLPQSQLSVEGVDSQEILLRNGWSSNAIDGSPSTYWHTRYLLSVPPHWIDLDLGANRQVNRLHYLPRQDRSDGRIAGYEVYLSTDGSTWGSPVATGTFPDTTAEQTVAIPPTNARYVRLRALGEVDGGPWTTVAELNVGVAPTG